jgi:uncharacterized protein DUF2510
MTEKPKAPPGWYAHPSMANTQRYWDGTKWTDHIAPGLPQKTAAVAPTVRGPDDDKSSTPLFVASLVMMIIFPIGGFIGGCVLLTRRAAAGAAIMLFSVLSGYVWYEVITYDDPLQCHMENIDRIQDGLPTLPCPD